eukprot:TRINITY_DN13661_c0_g1_i1.p1 TRINITY_DN13661_c0_g1~~TRINITY_DN13661_c0_g1_i1.p1  ORF type:complete len:726 (+),score=144.48 TRINITY_DN13661_c0_g1_i1:347-2524(+)
MDLPWNTLQTSCAAAATSCWRQSGWMDVPLHMLRTSLRCSDRELVLEAVREEGRALKYAADELRSDRKLVLEAFREDRRALVYAADELRSDRNFVLEAVRENGRAFQYVADEFRSNRNFMLEAVRLDGRALAYAADELRSDRELVLEAVREDGLALEYASDDLCSDRNLVLEAVRLDGLALEYASDELRSDREMVLAAAALPQDGQALKFAAQEILQERDFMLVVMKHNGLALGCVSKELQGDSGLVQAAVEGVAAYLRNIRSAGSPGEAVEQLLVRMGQLVQEGHSRLIAPHAATVIACLRRNPNVDAFRVRTLVKTIFEEINDFSEDCLGALAQSALTLEDGHAHAVILTILERIFTEFEAIFRSGSPEACLCAWILGHSLAHRQSDDCRGLAGVLLGVLLGDHASQAEPWAGSWLIYRCLIGIRICRAMLEYTHAGKTIAGFAPDKLLTKYIRDVEHGNEGNIADETSSSVPSSDLSSALQPKALVKVQPITKGEDEVREDLHSMAQIAMWLHGSDAAQAGHTFELVFDALMSEPGGAIVVVGQKAGLRSLDGDGLVFEELDGGRFLQVLRRFSGHILKHMERFKALMRAFQRHTNSDKWETGLLKELGDDLALEANDSSVPRALDKLNGQPKDGAIVLGLEGTVLAAVVKLCHNGSFRLVKENGKGAGTKHAAGLGVAEWMGRRGFLGVVFVKSDSGTVSVMLPCGLEAPQVLQVPPRIHF